MSKKGVHELIGKVVSNVNDKTITVLVENYRIDKKYKKRVRNSKKYCVHDSKNEAKVGDIVKIISTRPLSKTKHYRLAKIIEKAVII